MFRIDHHLHTAKHSPDSVIDPYELVKHAREIGLNGLVITEHDYQWEADELAELNAKSEGVLVLSGAEVSAREGHFLVYGLPNLDEAPAGVYLGDLIKVVEKHRGAIIGAHPFRWDQDFQAIAEEHGAKLNALELVSNNVTPDTRAKTQEVLDMYEHLGASGSSDGHEVEVIGCYFSIFPKPIKSMDDFVDALRTRSGIPGYRVGYKLSCGMV